MAEQARIEHRPFIHLKCSLAQEQIEDRLQYHPQLVEIQLFDRDMPGPSHTEAAMHNIRQGIRQLKQAGVPKVYLHHPMRINGKWLDVLSEDPEVSAYYRWSCEVLHEICHLEDVWCVVHPHYEGARSGQLDDVRARSELMREALATMLPTCGDRFAWENTPAGLFSSANPYWLSNIVEPLGISICYDVSHAFMSHLGDNQKMLDEVKQAFPYTRYYHVVDSMGTKAHDGLPLGEGRVDWTALKPFIAQRDFVFEVVLPDHRDCTMMVESAAYFASL